MAAPLHQWANGDPMSYVLVVDDQETVRDLLCRYLEGWDFDAHAFTTMNLVTKLL
jgi:CheY-like chemotaxis protein